MDLTDKRILAALERNARISAAELGRSIGLSRTAVQDRIARLETRGVITGYRAQIAGEDLLPAVLFVKIAVRPCDPALRWLSGLEGVREVISLTGEIDAMVHCSLPDAQALSRLNDVIGASDYITSATSSMVLRVL